MEQPKVDLSGRVVVVSGAGGGGIGSAITRWVAGAGATVIAVDVKAERLLPQVESWQAEGLAVTAVLADVLAEEGIATVIEAARRAAGSLYGLVTVVGGGPPPTWGPATRLKRQDWHALFQLNLDSMFFLSQAFARELCQQKKPGAIVAISSLNGATSSPFNVGYGASKAAMHSVVQTMALELAASNIRVNAIAPGPVATPTASLADDPDLLRRGIPMGRHGDVDEIAGPALFLLSPWSSFMTGQCLLVDGGCNIKWCHLSDDNLPMFLKNASVREALKNPE